MFARVLLMLTVVFGLVAGPAWTREVRRGAAELECGCCPQEVESCCVAAPAEPAQREPLQRAASSQELKQALAPVLLCLAVLPEAAPVVRYEDALQRASQPETVRLIDRICIRLI